MKRRTDAWANSGSSDAHRRRAPGGWKLWAGGLLVIVLSSAISIFVHDSLWPHGVVRITAPGDPPTALDRLPHRTAYSGRESRRAATNAALDSAVDEAQPAPDAPTETAVDHYPIANPMSRYQLTPMGAELAGNAEGTIPPWEGGITSAERAGISGYKPGDHHPDPFPDDSVLFRIDARNQSRFAAKLTQGHKRLLETYPDTYFLNVYPTRRSAAYPQRIYAATSRNTATAALVEEGLGVTGASVGVPFPIPTSGVEMIWNQLLRYRGDGAKFTVVQAPVLASGSFTPVVVNYEYYPIYADGRIEPGDHGNAYAFWKEKFLAPGPRAGRILLIHELLDYSREPRKAWDYSPSQRRVRRAPNVAFDNPRSGTDGLGISDELDMYAGSPERYTWDFLGKREVYVPYNAYKLHGEALSHADIIEPLHLNQAHARYELHRVWVVDARLKENLRHVYPRRTYYLDEDSWQIVSIDVYGDDGAIRRVAEGHVINYYDVPTLWTTLEVFTDLQTGRYLVAGLDNEQPNTYDFAVEFSTEDFSTSALRRDSID